MYSIYADDEVMWFQGADEKDYLLTGVTLTEEVNKAGSLEFTIPVHNKFYNNIERLKTTVVVKRDDEFIWRGRVLQTEKDFYNSMKVYCEGQLSFLQDSIVRPYSDTYTPAQLMYDLLRQHNAQVPENRRLYSGIVSVVDPVDPEWGSHIGTSQYPTTFTEITEKLMNRLGGYLFITWSEEQWEIHQRPYSELMISDQIIDFEKNLIDLKNFVDASDLYTRLVPLGAKDSNGNYLTIKTVNNNVDYIDNQTGIELFGVITKTQVWENVTVASNLLRKAQSYVQNSIASAISLDVKAVDLNYVDLRNAPLKIAEKIRVRSVPHGVDALFVCSAIKHDLENPANDVYTLGRNFHAITDS